MPYTFQAIIFYTPQYFLQNNVSLLIETLAVSRTLVRECQKFNESLQYLFKRHLKKLKKAV
jgi:hypothetical protein